MRYKPVRRQKGDLTHWNDDQIEIWRKRLGYISKKKVKDTLANTTQLLILEEDNPSYATMKMTYKKRYPFFNCCYNNDVAYEDIANIPEEAGETVDGDNYCLIVALRDKKYVFSEPINTKEDAYEAHQPTSNV